jgi:ArsR family transcriptional regulator, arsenate/arsenite/antimonite-responsive transcriptional repressor
MEMTHVAVSETDAVRALAALAQVQRLRAFRSLIAAGPDGTTPGALAEQLGIAPSGLSFHLKELAHAGLVTAQPRGRNLIYRASFGRMNDLLAYLTEHCCQGEACEVSPAVGCAGCE